MTKRDHIIKCSVLLFFIKAFCFLSFSIEEGDTVTDNFTRQLLAYPQEKVYLQTDKAHYLSGETIWFLATVVDALFHLPADENGEAVFDFYTADSSTTYSVVIEGITNDGKIIRHVSKISRN
jgi:hypothetical protein